MKLLLGNGMFYTKLGLLRLQQHDFWDSLNSSGNELIKNLQKVSIVASAITFAAIGFMMFYSNKSREGAKSAMPWALGGVLLVNGALALAGWATSVANF